MDLACITDKLIIHPYQISIHDSTLPISVANKSFIPALNKQQTRHKPRAAAGWRFPAQHESRPINCNAMQESIHPSLFVAVLSGISSRNSTIILTYQRPWLLTLARRGSDPANRLLSNM